MSAGLLYQWALEDCAARYCLRLRTWDDYDLAARILRDEIELQELRSEGGDHTPKAAP